MTLKDIFMAIPIVIMASALVALVAVLRWEFIIVMLSTCAAMAMLAIAVWGLRSIIYFSERFRK